jgi:hypothetical protein
MWLLHVVVCVLQPVEENEMFSSRICNKHQGILPEKLIVTQLIKVSKVRDDASSTQCSIFWTLFIFRFFFISSDVSENWNLNYWRQKTKWKVTSSNQIQAHHLGKKKSLCLIKYHAMNMYWGSGGIAPQFMTSALDGEEWWASRLGRFTPRGKDPGTHWIGCYVVPRAGLDYLDEKNLLPLSGIERRSSGQSLYRLSSPNSLTY